MSAIKMSIHMGTGAAPKISIIIPVFNGEKYIDQAIYSIVKSGITDYEILVIDDGSFDHTADVLARLEGDVPSLKVFHIENGGVSNARNYGMKKAMGDYIYFMDCDDVLGQDSFLPIQTNDLKCDLLIFGFESVNEVENRTVERSLTKCMLSDRRDIGCYINGITTGEKDIFFNYLWNRVFSKRIIIENDLRFDASLSLGEDFVFNCEYLKCCQSVEIISDTIYHYYTRNVQSLSRKAALNEVDRRKRMQKEYLSVLKDFECNEEAYKTFRLVEGSAYFAGIKRIVIARPPFKRNVRRALIKQLLDADGGALLEEYCLNSKGKKEAFCLFILRIASIRIKCFLFSLLFREKRLRR